MDILANVALQYNWGLRVLDDPPPRLTYFLKEDVVGFSWPKKAPVVAPLSRPDPFGGSKPSPGCSNVTQSPYQNHLSKTRCSVTLQLA